MLNLDSRLERGMMAIVVPKDGKPYRVKFKRKYATEIHCFDRDPIAINTIKSIVAAPDETQKKIT